MAILGTSNLETIGDATGVYLRGNTEAFSVAFGSNPATPVTLGVTVEWVEV